MKKIIVATIAIAGIVIVQSSCKKDNTCQIPGAQFTCSEWFRHECSKSEAAFFADTCVKAGGVIKK